MRVVCYWAVPVIRRGAAETRLPQVSVWCGREGGGYAVIRGLRELCVSLLRSQPNYVGCSFTRRSGYSAG